MTRKWAMVTGANRGIGLELTQQLLADEYSVIATARSLDSANALQKLERDYPKQIRLESLDVSKDSSVQHLRKRMSDTSQLDLLVSNAGIFKSGGSGFETEKTDDLIESFNTNAVGPLRVAQALLPWLQKSSLPIVANITSLMGSIDDNTSGGYYSYRMSKTALNMFNKSFSIDYPKIVSVVIHPGWVQTDMGGPNAKITTKESASGILKVLKGLKIAQTGKFLSYEGKEIRW